MIDLTTDQLIEMGRSIRPETPRDAFGVSPSELVNALAERLAECTVALDWEYGN